MKKSKIALLREEKHPSDNRVAFTPVQCQWLMNKYPELEIIAQASECRCFSDDEYRQENVEVREDVSDASLLMGIKEIPKEKLIAGKKYMFFSHTIKKQPRNAELLKTMVRKNIELVDYECLVWENGERILGFGHFAGVVGAHNGFITYGKWNKGFSLKPAHKCSGYDELIDQYKKIHLPPMKIAVTGTGRVAKGVYELLEKLNLRMVSYDEYLKGEYNEPVYVVLTNSQLYESNTDSVFSRFNFHQHPERFSSAFFPLTLVTDIFINAIFWDPRAPVFFSKKEMSHPDFRIKVIADITCDVNGSVPATIRETTISEPVFGYNPITEKEEAPYQPHVINVMAVSNLPNELPRESSAEFGDKLIEYVVEELLQENSKIIERATITKSGLLTSRFSYLQDYVGNN